MEAVLNAAIYIAVIILKSIYGRGYLLELFMEGFISRDIFRPNLLQVNYLLFIILLLLLFLSLRLPGAWN
jgi:hypothetical protein